MQSPLDDVPAHKDALVERDSVRILVVFTLVMLAFALGYLIIFPNREAASFSDVQWAHYPSLVKEDTSQRVDYSILLRSFEKETTSYLVTVFFDGQTNLTKKVSLLPGGTKILDFSTPIEGELVEQTQVKVVITRPNEDTNASPREALELVGYVP